MITWENSYISVLQKKKKDPKLYIHRNSAILGPFTLNETSSPTLVPSLMVLKVQSSGQQQQLLEIQTLRSHTDLWHQEPGVEPSNLCFNKPPRQFWCPIKCENHWLVLNYSHLKQYILRVALSHPTPFC